jgi:hypothetical protein
MCTLCRLLQAVRGRDWARVPIQERSPIVFLAIGRDGKFSAKACEGEAIEIRVDRGPLVHEQAAGAGHAALWPQDRVRPASSAGAAQPRLPATQPQWLANVRSHQKRKWVNRALYTSRA